MADAASSGADAVSSSIRQQLRALADTWRALADVRLGIFTLEARRAGTALARMLAFAVAAACLLAASWTLVVGCVMWWAIERGTDPKVVIAGALLVNLALAVMLLLGARNAGLQIGFTHTRRALQAPGSSP